MLARSYLALPHWRTKPKVTHLCGFWNHVCCLVSQRNSLKMIMMVTKKLQKVHSLKISRCIPVYSWAEYHLVSQVISLLLWKECTSLASARLATANIWVAPSSPRTVSTWSVPMMQPLAVTRVTQEGTQSFCSWRKESRSLWDSGRGPRCLTTSMATPLSAASCFSHCRWTFK